MPKIIRPRDDLIIVEFSPDSLLEKLEFISDDNEVYFTFFWRNANDTKNSPELNTIESINRFKLFTLLNHLLILFSKSNEMNFSQLKFNLDLDQYILPNNHNLDGHFFSDGIHIHDPRMNFGNADDFYPHTHLVFKTKKSLTLIKNIIHLIDYIQNMMINDQELFKRAFLICHYKQVLSEKYHPENLNISIEECIENLQNEEAKNLARDDMKYAATLTTQKLTCIKDAHQFLTELEMQENTPKPIVKQLAYQQSSSLAKNCCQLGIFALGVATALITYHPLVNNEDNQFRM